VHVLDGNENLGYEPQRVRGTVTARPVSPTPTPVVSPPQITGISPNPVPAINASQWVTINGKDFVFGLKIILRTGSEVYTIPITSAGWVSSNQVKIYPNFTAAPAQWTVQAVNPDGKQSNLFSFSVQAPAQQPAAPTNLLVLPLSASTATMSWTDNSNNETSFKIERKTGTTGTYVQIATQSQNLNFFNDSGLSTSTQYCYRVRATNGTGDSAYSNEACIKMP
jgi:hypothetical protein